MDPPTSKILSKILEDIIEWIGRPNIEVLYANGISLSSRSNLSTALEYVLKLGLDDESHFILEIYKKCCLNEAWSGRFEPQNYQKFAEIVASFMQDDLQELFKVPNLQQVSQKNLKENEIVAVFLSFLVHSLLNLKTVLNEDRTTILLKELRFLITILGDAPFQGAIVELEEIKKISTELEGVANVAGRVIHSLVVAATDQELEIIDDALGVLLLDINRLTANAIKLLEVLPYVTPNVAAVDSLFIVHSVLNDIEDLMNRDDHLLVDVKDQTERLRQGLTHSVSLLKDMKGTRNLEIQELKELVKRIREVAYEAEYVIKSSLVGDAPFWYLTMRLPHVINKIELIATELQEIKKNYESGALEVAKDLTTQLPMQPRRDSGVDEIIVGFEDVTTNILAKLVGGTKHLKSIFLFGMPGVGKTTLAKKLYNHPSVNYYFDNCSWCVVSQTHHRKSLLIEILISLTSKLDKGRMLDMEEAKLGEHIYKCLKGKRYLIMMDDIWDSSVWGDFWRYFPDDGNGSRILFTSRNKDVAPPNSMSYKLPSLFDDQCWELLEKKVFHNTPCPPELIGIGKQIAANCQGLPLAVVVIAGILSTMDKKEDTWKNVGANLASHIFSDQKNSMMQILKLSYEHLPEHLKPCFLYFGALSEAVGINAQKLKRLWIAEGFIHKEENKSMECIAEEYLMELIDKSLITVTKRRSDGGVKYCVIHNLLCELCLRIAEEENFIKWLDGEYLLYTKHAHLCLDVHHLFVASPKYLLPFGFHVRSIWCPSLMSSLCVFDMKLLRVLDLPGKRFGHGDGIEFLVHLRYLAVDHVPASIGSLANLELLIVKAIEGELVFMSSVLPKMVRLRFLWIRLLENFGNDGNSSQTNYLEFLSTVFIKKQKDEEMLKFSPHLRKLKCRCRPFWDEQMGEYRYPDL